MAVESASRRAGRSLTGVAAGSAVSPGPLVVASSATSPNVTRAGGRSEIPSVIRAQGLAAETPDSSAAFLEPVHPYALRPNRELLVRAIPPGRQLHIRSLS